jgi:hypothetical protein
VNVGLVLVLLIENDKFGSLFFDAHHLIQVGGGM